MGRDRVLSGATGLNAAPAITREQIEADWLRQDELRLAPAAPGGRAAGVTVEEDAAGGVDGVITGEWGFHTENEDNPWWQVDLGSSRGAGPGRALQPLRRLCAAATRGSWCCCPTTASSSGRSTSTTARCSTATPTRSRWWCKLDRPDGPLPAAAACRARRYFHLDEVEVFAAGKDENIALGKPATQSSISQWSKPHGKPAGGRERPAGTVYPTPQVDRARPEAGRRPAQPRRRSTRTSRRCRRAGRAVERAAGRRAGRGPAGRCTCRPAGRSGSWPWPIRCLDFDADPVRQAGPDAVPAHVRPVLRLVVARRRRALRAGRASRATSRSCAA